MSRPTQPETPLAANVYAIVGGTGFVDALARGILRRYDSAEIADMRILLPTRRACRALGDAFLRTTEGAPMLLPSMSPIGEVDEDEFLAAEFPSVGAADLPPAISPLRRGLLLARMVMARGDTPGPAHAARLARGLARLLDEAQTARVSFSDLENIVPDRYAEHWQRTLSFLRIVTEHWPSILQEQGCADHADRRNRLIEAQIARWNERPPDAPVIAAGSTGSLPATADLLVCVAAMKNGAVVLPGLDRSLDRASLEALEHSHPQFGMVRLLDRMGVGVAEIPDWESAASLDRFELVNYALRPAATAAGSTLPEGASRAFDGVSMIECPGPQQEALVIALLLREAVETPGKTAALVTPDRRLARRVAAELQRWNIDIDDSGGTPLADSRPGIFLRLAAGAIDAGPVALLALLKHPLAAGARKPGEFRGLVRRLERAAIRGRRMQPGFAGLREIVETREKELPGELVELSRWLADAMAPFAEAASAEEVEVRVLLETHVAFAEALAASDSRTGAERLWADEDGARAAEFVDDLCAESTLRIAGREWPALFEVLMEGVAVRPVYGRHPRLNIWGLLEARLQRADIVVMGGLNERVWPPESSPDPWMSRSMRTAFGLPPPERRVGLTAHDFVQGFSAPEVVMTRSTRVDGSPTVPARWLARIETLLSSAEEGRAVLARWNGVRDKWLHLQAELDRRETKLVPEPPAARPPVPARPARLSVTEIETLQRDPYAVYARRVLGLRRLDPVSFAPGPAERGMIVHDAIDRFMKEVANDLPDDALERFLAIGQEEFAPLIDRPGVRAFWWPRFERIARWIVDQENRLASRIAARHTEVEGILDIDRSGAPFQLVGRADRIDALSDGGYSIVDYKTGAVPSKRDVDAGLAPQLPLEAAMVARGAFGGIPAGPVVELSYWRLTGGDPAGEIREAGGDPRQLAEDAFEGVKALLEYYQRPETEYRARPDPEKAPRYSDYEHLERIQEWTAGGDGE